MPRQERSRGRSEASSRSIKSIVLISRKYELDPKLFVSALAEAWKKDTFQCGKLTISRRDLGQDSVTFLLTKDDKVVSQFPIRLDLLKNPDHFRILVQNTPFYEDIGVKPYSGQRRIAELRFGMKKVNVTAEIVEIPPKRLVTSEFGNQFYVSNVRIVDESGSIRLSLWNGQIDMVKVGDRVEVKDCYVANFAGEPQLRIGRSGTISVVA